MRRFKKLLWTSSGATEELEECPPSEQNNYEMLGGSVVMVAAIAAVTSGVAASYQFDEVWLVLLTGVIWATIVWNLERSILTSQHGRLVAPVNEEWMETLKRWAGLVISGLWRFGLAVLVGVLVAEVFLISFFRGPIDKHLRAKQRGEVSQLRSEYQSRIDSLRSIRQRLASQIDEKQELVNDYRALQSAEVAGDKVEIRGIETTGDRGDGEVASRFIGLVSGSEDVLARTRGRVQPRIDRIDSLTASIRADLEDRVSAFRSNFSNGVVTRFQALHEVSEERPSIWWAHVWLFGLLILVDTFPILMKWKVGGGPYDQRIRTELEKARLEEQMEREVAHGAQPLQKEAALNKAKKKIKAEEYQDITAIRLGAARRMIEMSNQELRNFWEDLGDHIEEIDGDTPFSSLWRNLMESQAAILRNQARDAIHNFRGNNVNGDIPKNGNVKQSGSREGDQK